MVFESLRLLQDPRAGDPLLEYGHLGDIVEKYYFSYYHLHWFWSSRRQTEYEVMVSTNIVPSLGRVPKLPYCALFSDFKNLAYSWTSSTQTECIMILNTKGST